MLTRRLIFSTEDDSTQVKENGANAHALFFGDGVVTGFGAALDFAPALERALAEVCSGLDSAFGVEAGSGLGAEAGVPCGASATASVCCSSSWSASRQLGKVASIIWRETGVALRQRGQCAS